MSIATTISPALVREQAERDQGCVDAMVQGTRPYAAPWGDIRFQEMVMNALARGGIWRRDAEKLAIIREVFGGKP